MADSQLRFDAEGFVDMDGFTAVDPDQALEPAEEALLRDAFAADSASEALDDDGWAYLLDRAFDAESEATDLALVGDDVVVDGGVPFPGLGEDEPEAVEEGDSPFAVADVETEAADIEAPAFAADEGVVGDDLPPIPADDGGWIDHGDTGADIASWEFEVDDFSADDSWGDDPPSSDNT